MWFGPVPLAQVIGTVLAHSVPLPHGRLRKGKVLDDADIAKLAQAGITEVTVARLDPGDVDEDSAAMALARALVPDAQAAGLRLRAVGTGRVNIHATGPGIARIDAARIHAANAADPAITVATLPEWQRVAADEMLATVKIIAYAVPAAALERACSAGRDALALCPPRLQSATLVQTVVGGARGPGKGQAAIAARLARLGVALETGPVVAHAVAPLADALRGAQGDMVLILTGSATSDHNDTGPEALRAAGGTLVHFGMPVDPGNLLFLGLLDGRPVVGLPGCARSPALNGADWVLERLICGVALGAEEITTMGVGGLLKESPARPRPRAAPATPPAAEG